LQVGLSGSSAIILATFNALLTNYQVTIEDMKIKKADLPEFILNIEKQELGIAAGLQDRVIQTYRGLVFMDFSEGTSKGGNPLGKNGSEVNSAGTNEYCYIDESLLPKLYLAYNLSAAGDSGKVHSSVKERWERRDPELVKGMQQLAGYAQKGAEALLARDFDTFAGLMENNFATRRLLYGDAVVGASNLGENRTLSAYV
jgi:glucuronokinase